MTACDSLIAGQRTDLIHLRIAADATSVQEFSVRTTVTIDNALYDQALQLAEPGMDKADLFREVFRTFVRVQSAKRLAALGASQPEMADVPRRRDEPAQ